MGSNFLKALISHFLHVETGLEIGIAHSSTLSKQRTVCSKDAGGQPAENAFGWPFYFLFYVMGRFTGKRATA